MAICIGIDAAKVEHWAVGIDDAGQVVLDRAVENNLAAIDAFISDLRALKGDVVIGIDVVSSFARFIEASLLAKGFALVHTPGIAVNRAGQAVALPEASASPIPAMPGPSRNWCARATCARSKPTTTRASRFGSRWGAGAISCRTRFAVSPASGGSCAAFTPAWNRHSTFAARGLWRC